MKVIFFAVAVAGLLTLCLAAQNGKSVTPECHIKPVKVPNQWVNMQQRCRSSMRKQIQTEVTASLQYLALGAHFARDVINRPGFAKLFFDAAGEEREHALKLIEYLLMRGELTADVSSLLQLRPPQFPDNNKALESGTEALEHALRLETSVTESIRRVIIDCEQGSEHDIDPNFNDYHLVDYLTGEFLEEQYKGQRDLAGKASTLRKMMDRHGALGEFIFDKKLLGMDI